MVILTILVSPHLDDVALSIGGMIAGNMLPRPLLNLNLFTKSIHAPYGYPGISQFIPKQLKKGIRLRKRLLTIEITRQRKREDFRFFRSQGIPCINLDLLEAPLRGHRNVMKVSHFNESDNAVFESVRSFILKLTSDLDGGYLLVPLGLTSHIDHQITRNASFTACGKLCPVFYEDLPYAADISMDEIEKRVASFNSTLRPVEFEIHEFLSTKIDNIKIYSSQIGKRQIDRTVLHAKRLSRNNGACERLWFPSNCMKYETFPRFDQSMVEAFTE